MEIRRGFMISLLVLLGVNVVLAIGAMAMLLRMSPAVERILRENVRSLQAVEDMIGILARNGEGPIPREAQSAFDRALSRARRNVTERAEPALIDGIEATRPAMFSGDRDARELGLSFLEKLANVNLRAMKRADRQAQNLGSGGAWAIAFFSLFGLALSIFVLRRLETRLHDPLLHARDVLVAVQKGDRFRRCKTASMPSELRAMFEHVNRLLDFRFASPLGPGDGRSVSEDACVRSALCHLLDGEEEQLIVVDSTGRIAAASNAALAELSGPEGALLRASLPPGGDGRLVASVALPESRGWICRRAEKEA